MSFPSVHLPTALVTRNCACDRETVGSALVDTPRHLDALTVDIGKRGILTPLSLGFNEEFGTLDGNHRIAVALRLGLESVPVALFREPLTPRPRHAQPMLPEDLIVLQDAAGSAIRLA
ncbi:hypothetical protein [Nonomuraea diastatica]|uniref:ParB/Sulfiredoxin domain-containing protein n=1 Tax=Nonomuraea diastatica TaxID=1848329 RepID=A0A4R4VRK4_9ACTN|nr:hypothetical protein [Nonomuraea diastatica]TDD06737.1 hypothetical protein E1294_48630 [Nonomuraea diastatica]